MPVCSRKGRPKKGERLTNGTAHVHRQLGTEFSTRRNGKRRWGPFTGSVELNPLEATSYSLMGKALLQMGDYPRPGGV